MERYQPFMLERLKQGKEEVSEIGWTHGLYVQRAIGSAISKNDPYPTEPLKLYGDHGSGDGEEEESYAPLTDADRFWAFASAVNVGVKD